MGTKTNPGAFNCYAAALPDEEIFTVLGRDPATPNTIRFWIGERARLGKTVDEDDLRRLSQAVEVADRAEAWRAKMLDPVGDGVPAWKLPRPEGLDDGPRICIDHLSVEQEETIRDALEHNPAILQQVAAPDGGLSVAQIAAARLQIGILYGDLFRLAQALVTASDEAAPGMLARGRLAAFLEKNPPREIPALKTGGLELLDAHENMRTHYPAWRSAMSAMASQGTVEGEQDDHGYWCHEIRALDQCMTVLGYVGTNEVPDMPLHPDDIETPDEERLPPGEQFTEFQTGGLQLPPVERFTACDETVDAAPRPEVAGECDMGHGQEP